MEQFRIVSTSKETFFVKAFQASLKKRENSLIQLLTFDKIEIDSWPGVYIFLWINHDYQKIPDCIEKLKRMQPDVKVLIIVQINITSSDIKRLLSLGNMGIIGIGVTEEDLAQFIDKILRDNYQWVLSDDILSNFLRDVVYPSARYIPANGTNKTNEFSPRENQILMLAKRGFTINETAEQLMLSRNTVATYRSKMLRKKGAQSFFELVVKHS